MCIICVDFQKQLITVAEARRIMGEMSVDHAHAAEMETMFIGLD